LPSPHDQDSAEYLLERLKDAVTGDAAQRALRRRYDALRADYEALLSRISDLEARLDERQRAAEPPGGRQAAGAGAPWPEPRAPLHPLGPAPAEEGQGSVREGLVGPLLRLRDEYLEAMGGIEAIVQGLDGLAAASFKGQRSSDPTAPRPAPVHEPVAERHLQVEVKGSDFGELLQFQERISNIPGVNRVSIKAIDNERATLVVELREDYRAG
jgi:hypothetical protein